MMTRMTILGPLLLSVAIGTSVAVAAFGFAYGGRQLRGTYEPPATPALTPVAIYGAMAVDAVGEDISSSDPVDASRQVSVGDTFKITVHVTDAGYAGYVGYRVALLWDDPILDYNPAAQAVAENVWPTQKAFCFRDIILPGDYRGKDASLLAECMDQELLVSNYVGPVAQYEFLCEAEGSSQLTLVELGLGGARLYVLDGSDVFELRPVVTNAEIVCVAPTPVPTSTPCAFVDSTPVPCTPTSTPSPTVTPTPVKPSPAAMAVDALGEDTAASDPVNAGRVVGVGEAFKVTIHVTGTGEEGYFAYQVSLRWDDPVLDYRPTAFRYQENVWPAPGGSCWAARDIGPPDDDVGKEAGLLFACADGGPGVRPSFYTGPVAQFEFVCEREGTSQLTLVPGRDNTELIAPRSVVVDPALTDAVVLCLAATPTSTPSVVPLTSTPGTTPTPCGFADSTPVACTPTATPTATVTPTPTTPVEQEAAEISLHPPVSRVQLEDGEFEVQVKVDGVNHVVCYDGEGPDPNKGPCGPSGGTQSEGVGVFLLALRFDPAIVTITGAEPGRFLGGTGRTVDCPPLEQDEDALFRFECDTLEDHTVAGPQGSGHLATLRLLPVSDGCSPLHLEAELGGPLAENIPVRVLGGAVGVEDECQDISLLTPMPTSTSTPTPSASAAPTATVIGQAGATPPPVEEEPAVGVRSFAETVASPVSESNSRGAPAVVEGGEQSNVPTAPVAEVRGAQGSARGTGPALRLPGAGDSATRGSRWMPAAVVGLALAGFVLLGLGEVGKRIR